MKKKWDLDIFSELAAFDIRESSKGNNTSPLKIDVDINIFDGTTKIKKRLRWVE